MPRSDFPDLEARAQRLKDKIRPILQAELAEGYGVTILVSNIGPKGGTAYLSNVERDSMISALAELTMNLYAERQGGPHEPTVVESLYALTRAAIRVLEVSEEHVSEEEGVKRFSELAALVGYKSPAPKARG
jgi:hypothetical protein